MIKEFRNTRFNKIMHSYSSLQNQQGRFCLCTRCSKTSLDIDKDQSHVCKRHDDFIKMTTELELAAPVFACADFEERTDRSDLLLKGLIRMIIEELELEEIF